MSEPIRQTARFLVAAQHVVSFDDHTLAVIGVDPIDPPTAGLGAGRRPTERRLKGLAHLHCAGVDVVRPLDISAYGPLHTWQYVVASLQPDRS
jgi:hypothetical protein